VKKISEVNQPHAKKTLALDNWSTNRLMREGRIATRNGRIPVELQLATRMGFPAAA
jgi:hypothetical protein